MTELITGTDLVAWQLDVAAGLPLPLTQDAIRLTGHAIEVRLYAEDPANQFMPQTGPIAHWVPASGPGIRIDGGIQEGQSVTPFYDSMLAKVIAYGANREEARRRLCRALNHSTLFGVKVNSHFLHNLVAHPVFAEGGATTAFIQEHFQADVSMKATEATPLSSALVAVALYRNGFQSSSLLTLSNWRSANRAPWPYELRLGEQVIELSLNAAEHQYIIEQEDQSRVELSVVAETPLNSRGLREMQYVQNGVRRACRYALNQERIYLQLDGRYYEYADLTHEAAVSESEGGSGRIVASMDGSIIDVSVEVGQRVTKGQTLLTLEAMKMEHPLKADRDGVVQEVLVAAGTQVKIRQLLVALESESEEEGK